MASFNVASPEKFSFKPEEWAKWIRRFECFRVASELNEDTQTSTLIYSMGDDADDILSFFTMSDDEREKYDAVKAKVEGQLHH